MDVADKRADELRAALLSREWADVVGIVAGSSERIVGAGPFGAAISLTRRLLNLIAEVSARGPANEFLRQIGCSRQVDWAGRVDERMGDLMRMEGSAGHRGLPQGYFDWCVGTAGRARAEISGRPAPPPIGAARPPSAFSPPPRALWRQKRIGMSPGGAWANPAASEGWASIWQFDGGAAS